MIYNNIIMIIVHDKFFFLILENPIYMYTVRTYNFSFKIIFF